MARIRHKTPDDQQHHDEISFRFDAGAEPYDYTIWVGDRRSDHVAGTAARDYLWGLAGNDRLYGKGEDDVLYGDQGKDLLVGQAGADRVDGGSASDLLFGGDGDDALMGGAGRDYLDEGAGHGMLEGGADADILAGGQGPDAFVVDRTSGNDVILDFTAGPGMFDHLALRDLTWEDLSFRDTAKGVLVSWNGGSVLLAGVSQRELAQDDFMFAEAPALPPSSRPATEPAPEEDSSVSSDGPSAHIKSERATWISDDDKFAFDFRGEANNRVVVGTSGDDTVQGGAAADHFFGLDGNDIFSGAGANDILQGDAGDDDLDGGAGQDKLDGGMGADRLVGGDQADELMGMDGDDVLDEGAGHGMLNGGAGDDFLIGGAGADAFIADGMSGDDVVFDFEALGEAQGAFDHLALAGIRPNQVTLTDNAAREWNGQSYTGVLVSWNVDSDAEAEGSALLVGLSSADLRQSDFMFEEEPGFVAGVSTQGSGYIFPQSGDLVV